MNYVRNNAILPFSKGKTSCDTRSMSDGTCDEQNNDMACDFDGGDCCEATCEFLGTTTPSPTGEKGDDAEICRAFDCKDPNSANSWIYETSNGDITYPFVTQRAFMNVLEAKNLTAGWEDLPSLSCPDCNAYNTTSEYLSIPFQVDTDRGYWSESKNEYAYTTVGNTTTRQLVFEGTNTSKFVSYRIMFPTLNETRERTFLGRNRVIGGVMLTQSRVELGQCSDLPPYLERMFTQKCLQEDEDQNQFGVDPTFVSTSLLYRSTNVALKHYDTDELNPGSGLPFGFFYDGGCDAACSVSHPVRHFPIMFDANFNVSRIETYLTLLHDGNYIDDYTSSVKVTLPMVNAEVARYILIRVEFQPQAIGNWDMEYKIDVIPTSANNWRGAANNALDLWQCFMELIYFSFFVILWLAEFREAEIAILHTGYVFRYFLNAANMINWINYVFQITAVGYWYAFVTGVSFQKETRPP